MALFTYYAALLKTVDHKNRPKRYWWFIDFPASTYPDMTQTDLKLALTKALVEHLKKYRIAPMATGTGPLLCKIKKHLAEKGRPVTDFLRYLPVTVEVNVTSPSADLDSIDTNSLTQYQWIESLPLSNHTQED